MAEGRRLLCSRVVDVWIDIDKAPDPDTEPLSYRGLQQQIEEAVYRATVGLCNDTFVKHVGAEVEVWDGAQDPILGS
jgi:hypothetical protein